MGESEERAQWGFELLLKRPDFVDFFDTLLDAGLFSFERSPKPIPGDTPGYVRIPYWPALEFLLASSKVAGDTNNLVLARKILDVIKTVSQKREPDGSIRDNYHTYSRFAEIFGLVPLNAVTNDDLSLIPNWLASKFDRGLVARELDTGILKRCLEIKSTENAKKACQLLEYCTDLKAPEGEVKGDAATVVDDYWLKELIDHHASDLGAIVGRPAAEIFLKRLKQLFPEEVLSNGSWLSRPAIEEHEQNHPWERPINRFVEGLRETLLAWIKSDPEEPKHFIKTMLESNLEIAQRMAIFILNSHWNLYKGMFFELLGPAYFQLGLVHEVYGLLESHFGTFDEHEKELTLAAIRQIPKPAKSRDAELALKLIQRTWLSALRGKGFDAAEAFFDELNNDQELGSLSEHPDFNAYMESWTGSGLPSYRVEEIHAFLSDGSLIQRLNDFKQSDAWRGPTTRALCDALEEAVFQKPADFLECAELFLNVKRPYQYGFVKGLKRAWENTSDVGAPVDWKSGWTAMIAFIERLIGDESFWAETVVPDQDLTPSRDWIPPIIAELLRSGTRDDARAYEPNLLPRTWALIDILLTRSEEVGEPSEDAMTQAINSPKGKAIEALFSHALRVCRLSDKTSEGHASKWGEMKSLFDRELLACKGKNFEFSTLLANYLANLEYIDREWLTGNILAIFPPNILSNFSCALEGLAYAPANISTYKILLHAGVIDTALLQDSKGRHAREKLIERIALAYLWGLEELTGPRFDYFFRAQKLEDLERLASFFWSVSNQNLSAEEVDRILNFWGRCMDLSGNIDILPADFLSQLSRLSCYIKSIDERTMTWLLAVAHYVGIGFNGTEFIEELGRLVESSPAQVSEVLGKVLEKYAPNYDYEDKLKKLLIQLSKRGQLQKAILFTNQLRHLPGMVALYNQLSQEGTEGGPV